MVSQFTFEVSIFFANVTSYSRIKANGEKHKYCHRERKDLGTRAGMNLKASPLKNLIPSLINISINFLATMRHRRVSLSSWQPRSRRFGNEREKSEFWSVFQEKKLPLEREQCKMWKGQGRPSWPDSHEGDEEQQGCKVLLKRRIIL